MTKRPFSKKSNIAQRLQSAFEYHVHPEPNSGCWIWTGPIFKNRGGYGCFTMRSAGFIQQRAHRVSWLIYRGEMLASDHVLHRCDNPPCVNPTHLFLGDQPANMDDKVYKGRQNKGEAHGRHKLTESEAMAIRADKRKQSAIAKDYGISVVTVSDIQRGRSWRHLGDPVR